MVCVEWCRREALEGLGLVRGLVVLGRDIRLSPMYLYIITPEM